MHGILPELFCLAKRTHTQFNKIHRYLTNRRRISPEFIIVGAQKAGTSSLYYYLSQHPQVVPAFNKEVHFFDLNMRRGMPWYRAHFPLRDDILRRQQTLGKMVVTGEASPYYLFHPHAAKRIAETLPSIKLIVLLRNPVDRARSHYHDEIRRGHESLSFEAAVEQEPRRLEGEVERMLADEYYRSFSHSHHSYTSRGIYVDQLQVWDKYFSPDQFLILSSEDLFRDEQTSYFQVLRFLGLDSWEITDWRPKNTGAYTNTQSRVNKWLSSFFEPHNKRLYEYLGRDFGW